MREIKFRVIFRGKVFGIEKLTESGWQWMVYELNPDKGERWSGGVLPADDKYIRNQFTGFRGLNGKGKEVYEGDTFLDNGRKGEVKMIKGSWMVEKPTYVILLSEFLKNDPEREVYGNIYEQ